MEFFSKFKEHQQTAREKDIIQQAHSNVKLVDFENKLYIAFHNTPMIPIEDNMSPADIIEQLTNLRISYIKYEKQKISIV